VSFGTLSVLALKCPQMRGDADLVVARLQQAPATAQQLAVTVESTRLSRALNFLREWGIIEALPGEPAVYRLALGYAPRSERRYLQMLDGQAVGHA